jgi:hypothetical protein
LPATIFNSKSIPVQFKFRKQLKKGVPMRKKFPGELAIVIFFGVLFVFFTDGYAENIDPDNDGSKYGYGENLGWLNAKPLSQCRPGVEVEDTRLAGYIWSENVGWVSLSCENTNNCSTIAFGVTNNESGVLSGYGWSENSVWISFSCENANSCDSAKYGVTIDPSTGEFAGYAWGENAGWISFRSTGLVIYGVKTSWVAYLNDCECDFEPDGDVDGNNLAEYIISDRGIALKRMAEEFGRINCD